jgi:anion-transporting  ArsA/GET3 family ATPase
VLSDVQTFIAAFDTLFGGFRQRAEATYALLQAPGTAFLVVAAPEPDALREAAYFVERLSAERMPLSGLVVNRVTEPPAAELDAADSTAGADKLAASPVPSDRAVAGLLRLHAERMRTAQREKRLQRRFSAVHPTVPTARVTALGSDVHDLAGLRVIGDLVAKQP